MPYLLPPLLLTLLALLPLLRAAHRRYAPADPAAEQRALIAAWRAADDPAGQDERDYRLYHELKNLRDGKAAPAARAPRWHIPAMLLASAAALLLWQLADHANSRRWHDLTAQLAPVLLRSQYLGEIAQIPAESLTIYCQALQQRIDRSDPQQLATLARCYNRDNQYPIAADIYAQSGKKNLAAPLWGELRRELAPEHPLYRLIPADSDTPSANTANAPTITVHIHPDTLASLPPTARLYVSASLPGERMPLAVRATAPALTQTLQLTDRDSMTGESLGSRPQLTYRAILSADGNVSGARLAEKEHTASGNATLTLELP